MSDILSEIHITVSTAENKLQRKTNIKTVITSVPDCLLLLDAIGTVMDKIMASVCNAVDSTDLKTNPDYETMLNDLIRKSKQN